MFFLSDNYERIFSHAGVGPTTNHFSNVGDKPEFDVQEELERCQHGYRDW
jgi:hypothetical protein